MNSLSSRKGIAEIIAAMLLILITLSAAILLGVYASGLMGHIMVQQSQPYNEQLTLDYYNWPTNPGSLKITVRNDGLATITLADFFVQGLPENTAGFTFANCPSNPYVLPVQTSCTITIPAPSGLTVTQGTAYTVKLVSKDGAVFTFSCIYGSYTH